MANIFQKIFGGGRKPQSVSYEGIKSLQQIPETGKYLLPWIQTQYQQGPEYWRDKFYNEVYQPTAALQRNMWETEALPQIKSEAGAMGMANSSVTIDRIAKELTRRNLEMAQYGGQLKAQGLETGRQERGTAQNRMADYINQEAAVNQNWAAQTLGAGQRNEQAISDYNIRAQEMPWYRAGQMVSIAGDIANMFKPGGGMGSVFGKQASPQDKLAESGSRSPYDFMQNPLSWSTYYKPQTTMTMAQSPYDGGMGLPWYSGRNFAGGVNPLGREDYTMMGRRRPKGNAALISGAY